jgi:RimJ/RimL family protein N-acetyltransferase
MDPMEEPRESRTTRVPVVAGAPDSGEACHPLPGAWEGVTGDSDELTFLEEAGGSVVRLDDGATVRLREARSEDGERLRRMFLGLSDQTRYLYFCAGVPANETWADRFATFGIADGRTSYALVAEMGDAPDAENGVIGLARFVRSAEDQSAEIGILLADAWQSRGLGGLVLDRLRVEAQRRAVAIFTGSVLWENRRMLRLARRVFPHLKLACAQGACDLTVALG